MSSPGALPGRFVSDGPGEPMATVDLARLAQVLDCFQYAQSLDQPFSTCIVAHTSEGALVLVDATDRATLPAHVKEQLLSHEALCPLRFLVGLRQIFLLDIGALEQVPDTPGMDDPLWLVGKLYGPFSFGQTQQPLVSGGKLSITRGEFLEAAMLGAPHAMHMVGEHRSGRHYHLLLPGDEQAAISQGMGAVLAYPRQGIESGNAPETAALLHDVLRALQEDLKRALAKGGFADQYVPQPLDRVDSQQEARAVTAPKEPRLLDRLMGLFIVQDNSAQPPAFGRVEDFISLVGIALSSMGSSRSGRMQALQQSNRLAHARWTPGESYGIEPIITVGNGAFYFDPTSVVLPADIAKDGGNINFRFDEQVLYQGRAADLEIAAWYFDAAPPGNIALCYRPVGSDKYAQSHIVNFTGSGQWKSLRADVTGALLTQTLWYGCDIDFYCVSKGDVRLQRVDVRLSPSSVKTKKQVGMDWSLMTLKEGGQGWLDHIASVPKPSVQGAPYVFPRWPDLRLHFDMAITDKASGSSDGEAFLVLSNDEVDYSIPAPIRTDRTNLEKDVGPHFKGAGRAGMLTPEQFPAGTYRCKLRLLLPGGAQYVEVEGGLWIGLVDKGQYSQVFVPGGRGWLDNLCGRVLDKEINEYRASELKECLFGGWVVDEQRRSPEGQVVLVLKSNTLGAHGFDAVSRSDSQDVVDYLKDASYLRSGFSGMLKGEALKPGIYKCLIRLIRPDWLVYTEFDTLKWIRVVDDTQEVAAPSEEFTPGGAVVFHDPRYPSSWIGSPQLIAERLSGEGFQVLGAKALKGWMERAIADGPWGTVCVMAHDIVPDTVCEQMDANVLIRRYLNAGGRVVWPGDVPFYYQGTAGVRSAHWAVSGQLEILGIEGCKESKAKVSISEHGRLWGITVHGQPHRSQKVSEVTLAFTTLGRGLTESWLINFCPDRPLSGFVRYFAGGFSGADDEQMASLLALAKFGLGN